jgi:peptidoglycan/LPS O-acetylase OafA/YrhL
MGVTLFFVLSGFLITGILWDSFDKPHWWRNFYARRTLRIFPLYFGSIILVLLAASFAGTFRGTVRLIWIPILFLQNMPHLNGLIDKVPSPLGLFHFWSLAVEEQFYLFWPLLLVLQKSRSRAQSFCLYTFLFSALFRILIWNLAPTPDQFGQFLLTRAGELAAGAWLALAYRGPSWSTVERFAPIAAIGGSCGFVISGVLSGTMDTSGDFQMTFGLPCITVCCAGVLVLALRPGIVQRCAEAAWLRWLGGISYGIYVYHMLFLRLFILANQKILGQRSQTMMNLGLLVIAAIGSVSFAWLSFHLFESPFLKLKGRFSTRSI